MLSMLDGNSPAMVSPDYEEAVKDAWIINLKTSTSYYYRFLMLCNPIGLSVSLATLSNVQFAHYGPRINAVFMYGYLAGIVFSVMYLLCMVVTAKYPEDTHFDKLRILFATLLQMCFFTSTLEGVQEFVEYHKYPY